MGTRRGEKAASSVARVIASGWGADEVDIGRNGLG